MQLIVDSRETATIPFLDEIIKKYKFSIQMINTGDYIICSEDQKIFACIERKTHKDFAASFKDLRYQNFEKMKELRDTTGCQLYLFLEGPAFPSAHKKYDGIYFSNILAAATILIARDGIFMIQTENAKHTIERINDLLNAFAKIEPKPAIDTPLGSLDSLRARYKKTNHTIVISLWANLDGIAIVLGELLANSFSISDLVTEKIDDNALKALKTTTGYPLNTAAMKSLTELRAGNKEVFTLILAGIQGITKNTAECILSEFDCKKVCSTGTNELSAVQIKYNNSTKKLGTLRAERIITLLNYKTQ